MIIAIIEGSHVDHELSDAQITWALAQLADAPAGLVTVRQLTLPTRLGRVPSALWGPAEGDQPIPESSVVYRRRGDRAGESRCIDGAMPRRMSRHVTVVVGPAEGHEGLVLYTCYGGACAPREPWDTSLSGDALAESRAFWAEHALAYDEGAA